MRERDGHQNNNHGEASKGQESRVLVALSIYWNGNGAGLAILRGLSQTPFLPWSPRHCS